MWIQYSTMEWKEVLLLGPCVVQGHAPEGGHMGKNYGGGLF